MRRVLVLGATGTIGRAVVRALVAQGHEAVALVRRGSDAAGLAGATVVHDFPFAERQRDIPSSASEKPLLAGRDLADARHGYAISRGDARPIDAVISCLASRSGVPRDAWAVDHDVNLAALHAAQAAGIGHFVLLSAICVQRPRLAFQNAKLAFEHELAASGIDWTIVRPTAFFKSLSGQIARVQAGKAFLVFGDGTLTACKPIGDEDLARYLVDCLDNPDRRNRILPIGGPGPAITPADQAAMLGTLLGRAVRLRPVPVALLDTIIAVLSLAGRIVPRLADKAELARIGRYYATESMLVLDPGSRRYDADATPETGTLTLRDHYARVIAGDVADDRGEHAVFRG